jgi:23S rRNA A1618 N6-methylase RlmF
MALNVHKVADSNHNLLDLLGQFAGRSKNQSLTLLDVGVKLLQD